ncbi:Transmembrane protein [Parasponia andersonii]|uniref:Transmembrane protein n=1 Tax=Parasponia andersonii TaxID=3476 RepID=A0A2P5D622_PARAD|nr:Transmembrane protein [Parasponia andersonii]
MGALVKVMDAILFVFFTIIAVAAPLIDAQTCLPGSLVPDWLGELTRWYAREFDDYLVAERPHFFVGLLWLEFLFQWPLALLNLYGILGAKSWFNTTCLIYGVSASTALAAILSEIMGSGKASDKLIMIHLPFLGFAALATLRGLLPQSGKTSSTAGKVPAPGRKKRA